ncbi:hypothetical protein BDY19DRAFT_954468 [Irpex rosettiformis]|uniref:Uncharacterized protein n=1 Tax=Irpex rosettiformis TaxID=378272 RepID=A0ACB8TZR0_9APHY|nr:hypothetical protein BDY19DRAFT_954468 [Irpex rosettiformis]
MDKHREDARTWRFTTYTFDKLHINLKVRTQTPLSSRYTQPWLHLAILTGHQVKSSENTHVDTLTAHIFHNLTPMI